MFKGHKKIKQNDCLICFKPIYQTISVSRLIKDSCICLSCEQSFKRILYHSTFEGYSLTILYEYNDFFKECLFRYKGQYDYALKEVFLSSFTHLRRKYRHYYVLPAPHTTIQNQERAFHANREIVSTFSKQVFALLVKNNNHKQASSTYEERKQIRGAISIHQGEKITGKNVLLFDDVITSGETIKACIKEIEKYHPKRIEILILASKSFIRGE